MKTVKRRSIEGIVVFVLFFAAVSVLSDTAEEAGQALMALLKQRNSAIDTNDGKVIPENALDNYKKNIVEGKQACHGEN